MTTINDRQVHTWSLHWARYGLWRADVIVSDGDTIAAGQPATIKCGSLSLVGAVLRSGLDAADRPHITVAGGLGWQSTVTAPVSYQSDAGVQLRTVLTMLSKLAGQAIELPPDSQVGDYYELTASRPGTPVRIADALNELVRDGLCPPWRLDPDGVTRFGARAPVEVATRATPLANNKSVGCSTYGIDDPVDFLPGNTIGGAPIERLDLRETDGKLEVDVYSSDAAASIREQIRRMVAHELEDYVRTYTVTSCGADGRCNLAPPPDATHLPELRNVEQWIMGGAQFVAQAGDEAIVCRRDRKNSRPVIIGFRRLSGSEAYSFPQMARVGDIVQSGGKLTTCNFSTLAGAPVTMVIGSTPAPGPYLVSFSTLTSGGPVPPTPLSAGPLYGSVTSGSRRLGGKTQ